MPVTLKDIATRSGVSVQTVSSVLGGKAAKYRISDKRVSDVRQVANELGYRPNAAARAVRGATLRAIGVLASKEKGLSPINHEELTALEETLAELGHHLVLGRVSQHDLVSGQRLPKLLREWLVNGFVVSYLSKPPAALEEVLTRWRLKSVWMNNKRPTDAVRPDDEGSAKTITGMLAEMGHRRIAYLPSPIQHPGKRGRHYSHADREQGFRDAMQASGLAARVMHAPPTDSSRLTAAEQVEWGRALLSRDDRPTAVVAYSRHDAAWLAESAQSLGMRLPQDLSVIGYGPDWHRPDGSLAVATALLPHSAMGHIAAKLILDKIDHGGGPRPSRVLPVGLFYGQTFAPPGQPPPAT